MWLTANRSGCISLLGELLLLSRVFDNEICVMTSDPLIFSGTEKLLGQAGLAFKNSENCHI